MDPAAQDGQRGEKPKGPASAGTIYLVLIQVTSRALTFVGNQFLLRYLSPIQLGLAVQLELVSITILYTSRESLRVALQRQPVSEAQKHIDARGTKSNHEARTSQQTVNLAYLVLLVGLCASMIFGYAYLSQCGIEVLQSSNFWLSFKVYGAATFIELLAEPCFVIVQQRSLYQARARAETAAAIARCTSACLTAIVMHSQRWPASVLPFAIGQLLYAGTLFLAYLTAVAPIANANDFSLLPHTIDEAQTSMPSSDCWLGLFPSPLLTLTTTFYAQSLFKLLLTQGDSLILSLISDLKSQGAFALASNYGGLLSRLLFQPIEESSRNIFGHLLAPDTSVEASTTSSNIGVHDDAARGQTLSSSSNIASSTTPSQETVMASPHFGTTQQVSSTTLPLKPDNVSFKVTLSTTSRAANVVPTQAPSRSDQTTLSNNARSDTMKALDHLTTILHAYTLFALPLVSLLPHLLPPLIQTLIGTRWSSPATNHLLATYAYYLPFLAVNGILDAFVTSVASPRQLRAQSTVMAGVTVVYGLVAWILVKPPLAITEILGGFKGVGPAALVWANIVNMGLRIVYAIYFIRTWVERRVGKDEARKLWKLSLPNLGCVATMLVTTATLSSLVGPTDASRRFMGIKGLNLYDVGLLIASGVVLASSMLLFEQRFLISVFFAMVPQRLTSKIMPYLPKQKEQ